MRARVLESSIDRTLERSSAGALIHSSTGALENRIRMRIRNEYKYEYEYETKTKQTENKASTENRRERRPSVDGEQAVAGLWPGILKKKANSLVCTTGMDLNKRGLEQGVDLNKAWTRTKRGLEQSVDLNKAWT